jgi:calcyclin binding protein
MDMMKNMYEDGDENMKRIIGEAMLKSQRGEKMSPPSMDDI